MSYFVTITFDLKSAKTTIYPKIKADFEKIDFNKYIKSRRKKTEKKLPSNTFVALFETVEFEGTSELRNWLKEEIKKIFNAHNVTGKYFIAIGKGWSWSVGNV